MPKQTALPRWRGFNLMGGYMTTFHLSPGYFEEEYFQIISDWGFDFVRLPLTYRFWVDNDDPFQINEEKLSFIDKAVLFGKKYGIHVNIAFHRGPGYCVNNEATEPFDLWKDAQALEAFKLHWVTFAKRYKGYNNEKVSFNLVNEPFNVSPESHAKVMRATIAAIREVDPERLVILDGLCGANIPMPDLGDLNAAQNVAQSCRAYKPGLVTHYLAEWVKGAENYPEPSWPVVTDGKVVFDRAKLEQHFNCWAAMAETYGFGVHCGEGGCFNRTPHDIALRWLEDTLEILKSCNIGYAMWGFNNRFGVLDAGRTDVDYADFRGHKLDVKMLKILQKY